VRKARRELRTHLTAGCPAFAGHDSDGAPALQKRHSNIHIQISCLLSARDETMDCGAVSRLRSLRNSDRGRSRPVRRKAGRSDCQVCEAPALRRVWQQERQGVARATAGRLIYRPRFFDRLASARAHVLRSVAQGTQRVHSSMELLNRQSRLRRVRNRLFVSVIGKRARENRVIVKRVASAHETD